MIVMNNDGVTARRGSRVVAHIKVDLRIPLMHIINRHARDGGVAPCTRLSARRQRTAPRQVNLARADVPAPLSVRA